jgi:hypothetical protein
MPPIQATSAILHQSLWEEPPLVSESQRSNRYFYNPLPSSRTIDAFRWEAEYRPPTDYSSQAEANHRLGIWQIYAENYVKELVKEDKLERRKAGEPLQRLTKAQITAEEHEYIARYVPTIFLPMEKPKIPDTQAKADKESNSVQLEEADPAIHETEHGEVNPAERPEKPTASNDCHDNNKNATVQEVQAEEVAKVESDETEPDTDKEEEHARANDPAESSPEVSVARLRSRQSRNLNKGLPAFDETHSREHLEHLDGSEAATELDTERLAGESPHESQESQTGAETTVPPKKRILSDEEVHDAIPSKRPRLRLFWTVKTEAIESDSELLEHGESPGESVTESPRAISKVDDDDSKPRLKLRLNYSREAWSKDAQNETKNLTEEEWMERFPERNED